MPAIYGGPAWIDVAAMVAEPYPRAGEVAKRLLDMMPSQIERVVVANKIGNDADLEAVRRFLGPYGSDIDVIVPADEAVASADSEGVAPLDHAPGSPAVTAMRQLADCLHSYLGTPLHA